jgi:hypothetical protein
MVVGGGALMEYQRERARERERGECVIVDSSQVVRLDIDSLVVLLMYYVQGGEVCFVRSTGSSIPR